MSTDRAFAALVRRLHAAELLHLREVLAEHQQVIEAQAQRIADLEREVSWAEGRADMFADIAESLREAGPGAHIGITQDGSVGVWQ